MAGRQRRCKVHPGPDEPSLLHLQSRHVSEAVWEGYADRVLSCRRWARDHDGRPPAAIVPYLQQAGFYGVARLRSIHYESGLVSALVERWRPETHTFHLPHGECTITLEDVAVQLGLPCVGTPVIGSTHMNWRACCLQWLGQMPPDNAIDGQRLSLDWLHTTFNDLAEDATEEQRQQYARAYILRLIGGVLMVDKSSHFVYLMYLPLLANLQQVGQFSWGSAVLAYLYRELCNATNYEQKEIAGCLTLLHLWAWDRFPQLAPDVPPQQDSDTDLYEIPPPLGFRWAGMHRNIRPPVTIQRHYRIDFDLMIEDEIIWRPYETRDIPPYCIDRAEIWRANVPLLCFHILEWHQPDQVMRQFDFDQRIPEPPIDLQDAHTTQLSGKTQVNWINQYHEFIMLWIQWENRVVEGVQPARPLRCQSEYMQWYTRHTRRFIDPACSTSRYAANIVEDMQEMCRGRGDNHFQQKIDKLCIELLVAIRQLTETVTLDRRLCWRQSGKFHVSPMPQDRVRRVSRGFDAMTNLIQSLM